MITDECMLAVPVKMKSFGSISGAMKKYVIDPKLCNDWWRCADQCPVEAIIPGEDK